MKSIISLLLIGFLTINIQAQEVLASEVTPQIEQQVENEVKILKNKLALTGKQESLIRLKLKNFGVKEQEIIKSSLQPEEKKKAVMALKQNEVLEMRNILTDAQYNQYVSMMLEKK
ncbi:hypothetical protein [Mesonia sp. HuA40]|uniref:hypothetical protein n=1 Tax=Mesonia sp. HuA40 TaxID=2602761 RepID=UPI0011CAE285|nr:hypothetical protein [Mesonia sp. HuA40]TXK70903.1 hypothetical protein FT993_09970 [Mesonia sp. HuA40]